jgi:hemoglobin-like flavoprotein
LQPNDQMTVDIIAAFIQQLARHHVGNDVDPRQRDIGEEDLVAAVVPRLVVLPRVVTDAVLIFILFFDIHFD